MSHHNIVEPDLLYASHERAREIMIGNWMRGALELVVEIGSAGTEQRDETLKRRLSEQFGVVEYWRVDPEAEPIRAFRRAGETFGKPVELTRAAGGGLRSAPFQAWHCRWRGCSSRARSEADAGPPSHPCL